MKAKITSLLLCAGILAFTSCSNENKNGIDSFDNTLRVRTDIQTRSVIESTTFSGGEQIGVYALNSEGVKYSEGSWNMRATYDARWYFDNNLSLTTQWATIYAYYPYSEGASPENMVKVNITRDPKTGQPDYLYGKSEKTVNAAYPEAYITFKHALARITLDIKKSSTDVGNGVLTQVCLRNAAGYTSLSIAGDMDIKTGYINPALNENAAITLTTNYTLNSSTSQLVDILVIPAEINENSVELELTIDGSPYIVKLPAIAWEAGEQYTYPITINRQDAHITTQPAKIGDYYYSDQTWSTEYNKEKTCIGIVFALSEEKDGDINVSLAESMHGRIVALEDLGKYAWGPIIDIENIIDYSGCAWNGTADLTLNQNYLPIDGESHYRVAEEYQLPYNYHRWLTTKGTGYSLTDYAGRQHSSYLQTEKYPAGHACYTYSPAGGEKGFWYLPSTGEFGRLMMACGIKTIDNSKQKIFNNLSIYLEEYDIYSWNYWTSTEGKTNYAGGKTYYNAWIGSLENGGLIICGSMGGEGVHTKETAFNVRPIASF